MIVIKNIRFGITEAKYVIQTEDDGSPWILIFGGIALVVIALI